MRKFAFLMVLLPLCLIGYVCLSCMFVFSYDERPIDRAAYFLLIDLFVVLLGYTLSSLVVKVGKATIENNKKKDEEVRKELACDIFIGNALKVFWVVGYGLLAFGIFHVLARGFVSDVTSNFLFFSFVASLLVFYAIYEDWELRLFSIYLYDAEEQLNKGVNYVERGNYSKALKCFKIAAELGNQYAQYDLGLCYHNGVCLKQDYKKAVKWYTKAAEQGYAGAQHKLGCCYAKGYGVAQDHKKAFEWWTKAAEQGDEDAKKDLERLKNEKDI